MLNSPGSEQSPTILQDFVETLAEGKVMGMDEKKVCHFLPISTCSGARTCFEAADHRRLSKPEVRGV